MGYADHIGFRAGMSRPYKAYDVAANRPLDLTIHPTAAMDATLNRYMGLSPGQALDALEQLAGEVKAVDGELTLCGTTKRSVNATNGRGGVRCTNKYLNAFVKAETMVTDLSQADSVVNEFVAELRDASVQQDPLRFRFNLQRLGSHGHRGEQIHAVCCFRGPHPWETHR